VRLERRIVLAYLFWPMRSSGLQNCCGWLECCRVWQVGVSPGVDGCDHVLEGYSCWGQFVAGAGRHLRLHFVQDAVCNQRLEPFGEGAGVAFADFAAQFVEALVLYELQGPGTNSNANNDPSNARPRQRTV
jgi:hypothetical protein